jgi:hypothetical protein
MRPAPLVENEKGDPQVPFFTLVIGAQLAFLILLLFRH